MTIRSRNPLRPATRARRQFPSGDVSQDGLFQKMERSRSHASKHRLTRSGFEPGAFKRDRDKSKSFNQAIPRYSDLWYLWDVFQDEDNYPEDPDEADKVFEKLGAAPVRTIQGTSPGQYKKRLFPLSYQFIPQGKTPLDEEPYTKEGFNMSAALNMLSGDLSAVQYTTLVAEESAPVSAASKRSGGELLPPPPEKPGEKEIKVTEDFYLVDDDSVETFEFKDKYAPFFLLKKRVVENEKFPLPGELIGLAVRAFPNHAWFNQESNPFIFSGNWFETGWYTSGVVTKVNTVDANSADNTYDVRIRGKVQEKVKSTDYLAHSVDDRVAVFKIDGTNEIFTDKDMGDFNPDWLIVPISFYKE